MCGVTGAIACGADRVHIDRLKPMVDAIAHRGPDDAGYWLASTDGHSAALTDRAFAPRNPGLPQIDDRVSFSELQSRAWQVMLGHRRLSILDLSEAGHQPMALPEAALCVSYNGEIYNAPQLRTELAALGWRFRGHSDTEVLLAAWAAWGPAALPRLNGMFAFALYDGRARRLHLVRDRYGIKPLYLAARDGTLCFGSEIKALLEYLPGFPGVDLLAFDEYFSFQNVFSSRTLFEGVSLLPPATHLSVDLATGARRTERYWDFDFWQEFDGRAEADLEAELAALIAAAVDRQCLSDVPIGCYLSGGLDSGTITALAARRLGRIHTFTCGFDLSEATQHEQAFDERAAAELMANAFQTEHYECVLHSGDMAAVLPDLVWHLEDLRVGQSYPNFCVAKLASRFVKVVMSGVGGDELFGGYPWRYAAALGVGGEGFVANYYRYWKRLVSNSDKPRFYHPDVARRMHALDDPDGNPFRDYSLNMFRRVLPDSLVAESAADQVRLSLYFECRTFLHGLLVVEDKLAMAHSLESRVPMLDNELIDFALRVPVTTKVSGLGGLERLDENALDDKNRYRARMASGKNVLRRAMQSLLPPSINQGRKQGFSGPDESWFRGRASDFVSDTLFAADARSRDWFATPYLREVLAEHGNGTRNHRLLIWSLVSFELWLRRFAAHRPHGFVPT